MCGCPASSPVPPAHRRECCLMAVPSTTPFLLEVVREIGDSALSQVSLEGDQSGMILLMLAVLASAAVGDPVKHRSPVTLDDCPPNIGLGSGVAKVGEGVLDVLCGHAR